MFTIERTDIKRIFGTTLEQVIQSLYDGENTFHKIVDYYGPEQLLNVNPHAIKILEQNPEYICPDVLYMNPSHEAIYLQQSLKTDYSLRKLSLFIDSNCNILDTYLREDTPYKIDDFTMLSSNPRAIPYLRRHMYMICWKSLSKNPDPEALDLLESFPEKIDFVSLCANKNPRAMAILRENLDKLDGLCWSHLSENSCEEAIDLLIENPQHISYWALCINPNPRAIEILRKTLDKINIYSWHRLSGNTCNKAIEILRENIDKIQWYSLSSNPCNEAVDLLMEHPNEINWDILCLFAKTKKQFELIRAYLGQVDWTSLSMNSSELAVKLLEEHPDRIQWNNSLRYQNVFETITTYDYAGIREARRDLHQEFHAWAGHPSMITKKWRDWGFDTYGLDEVDGVEDAEA